MKKIVGLLLLIFTCCLSASAQYNFPFGNEVQDFKRQDSLHMPKPGGILFIGSSSIRLWDDLEQRFAAYPVIKRGLGGSTLHQWVQYYTPYVLFPYWPAKVFIYVGENDIANNVPATQVADDFATLWRMINTKLPKAEIYFLSIKQSPSRAKYYEEVLKANQLIKQFMAGKPHTHIIDVNTPLLNSETHVPDSGYFKSDYLHLKSNGYDRWAEVIKPYLK
jgi:lysophospholipase L1-like esterase